MTQTTESPEYPGRFSKLPYAVLIDESGILVAQGLSNSREHLESLFEAKRLRVASVQEYLERKASVPREDVKTG